MSLHGELVTDRAHILADFGVTVVNLNTKQTCEAMFDGGDVAADNTGGLKNTIKSVLWIPREITTFSQEHKLMISLPDGTQLGEFTVAACGSLSGPFRKVEVTQSKVTRMREGIRL